jgi:hypothetical protein
MNEEQEQTILPLPFWAVLLIVIFCWPSIVLSEPRFRGEGQGIVVTLYDDKCELDNVTNLPFKATWQENGKTTEGCWSIAFDRERINTFFVDDKSVVSFPPSMFTKLTGV